MLAEIAKGFGMNHCPVGLLNRTRDNKQKDSSDCVLDTPTTEREGVPYTDEVHVKYLLVRRRVEKTRSRKRKRSAEMGS